MAEQASSPKPPKKSLSVKQKLLRIIGIAAVPAVGVGAGIGSLAQSGDSVPSSADRPPAASAEPFAKTTTTEVPLSSSTTEAPTTIEPAVSTPAEIAPATSMVREAAPATTVPTTPGFESSPVGEVGDPNEPGGSIDRVGERNKYLKESMNSYAERMLTDHKNGVGAPQEPQVDEAGNITTTFVNDFVDGPNKGFFNGQVVQRKDGSIASFRIGAYSGDRAADVAGDPSAQIEPMYESSFFYGEGDKVTFTFAVATTPVDTTRLEILDPAMRNTDAMLTAARSGQPLSSPAAIPA